MTFRRDAVVGKEVAEELMMARSSGADRVDGTSVVLGWKRSGYLASVHKD